MSVLCCGDILFSDLQKLLLTYGLQLHLVEDGNKIPGSWFGEPEAGLIDNNLYVRSDTPVHSALHESCHFICMPPQRRTQLHTNAGGDYDEENAVCFLSILLSNFIPEFGQNRMMNDMDEWGYTFRLGSSKAWFEEDAQDAHQWLIRYGLITDASLPCWVVRSF